MSKCWIYHKTEEPKVVDAEEAQSYYAQGWADTPAAFFDASKHIDVNDEVQVQLLGETIQDITDEANDALNDEAAEHLDGDSA